MFYTRLSNKKCKYQTLEVAMQISTMLSRQAMTHRKGNHRRMHFIGI